VTASTIVSVAAATVALAMVLLGIIILCGGTQSRSRGASLVMFGIAAGIVAAAPISAPGAHVAADLAALGLLIGGMLILPGRDT
jgi:hypothetical protein